MGKALDRQAFFEVMASFPTGVAVVTPSMRPASRAASRRRPCAACRPTRRRCSSRSRTRLARSTPCAAGGASSSTSSVTGEPSSACALHPRSRTSPRASRGSSPAEAWPLLHEDAIAWAECTLASESTSPTIRSSSGRSSRAVSPPSSRPHFSPTGARGASGRPRTSPSDPEPVGIPSVDRGRPRPALSGRRVLTTRGAGLTVMSAGWDTRGTLTCHKSNGRRA